MRLDVGVDPGGGPMATAVIGTAARRRGLGVDRRRVVGTEVFARRP